MKKTSKRKAKKLGFLSQPVDFSLYAAVLITACAGLAACVLTFTVATSAATVSTTNSSDGGYPVTPMQKVPPVPPPKDATQKDAKPLDASSNMTLKQKCQNGVAKELWGACCTPPDYLTSAACQAAKKKAEQKQPEATSADQGFSKVELKLLPVAWQNEYVNLNTQFQKFLTDATKFDADATKMRNCEVSCPGGGYPITCTTESKQTCIDHDACIKACDVGYPQLKARMDKLNVTRDALQKKGDAFTKKVEVYKAKNAKKFRAIEGANR